MVALDYLVIGHITKDIEALDSRKRWADSRAKAGSKPPARVTTFKGLGGTALYAARTAHALGCRVGVITSARPELDLRATLNEALVVCVPAAETTIFENRYTDSGRRQLLHSVAETLTPAAVPVDWNPTIVHLGPVARECDPSLIEAFADAFLGLTLQGWLRHWDQDGHIYPHEEEAAVEKMLPQADAVVVSEEDVDGDRAMVERYASQTHLLVLTQGERGCTVYTAGQKHNIPVSRVEEANPTGAGDIFAAAFFVKMERGGDPWQAARFANCIASRSVTRWGPLASPPRHEEIARCEQIAEEKAYAPYLRTG